MNVVIDHREPEVFRTLFPKTDVITISQLGCGDFLIGNRWLFERKTIHDLAVSLVDGRLFRQALALLKSDAQPAIILEGGFRDAAKTKVGREALQGALITLTIFFGLPVLRSFNPEETVKLMRYTAKQDVRFADGAVQRFGYRPRGKRARKLYVLQGLPGIGSQRAKALLDHFGCIETIMCAPEDQLAQVEGIGRLTAQSIRNLVGMGGNQ